MSELRHLNFMITGGRAPLSGSRCLPHQPPSETATSSVLLDPVDELGDARVDSGLAWLGAAAAEADDAVQPPSVVDAADERTAGVALARVLAAGRVPGAQHVLGDLVQPAVERRLVALRLRDDRNDDLTQNRRPVARRCAVTTFQ